MAEVVSPAIAGLAREALDGRPLSRGDVQNLVHQSEADPGELLYWANRIRSSRFGNTVRLCTIVAGKLGSCGQDCKWCAQSAVAAPGVTVPSVAEPEQMHTAAREAAGNHATSLGIVNSGRRPSDAEMDAVVDAVHRIRSDGPEGLRLCASLGELTGEQARRLVDAGIVRYNHNIETSRRLFPEMVTTHTYDDRVQTLTVARNAGLEICCGGIFGLGETWDDRIEIALTLRDEIRPSVVPLNFLHPIPSTPLAETPPLEPMEILRIIAVFRFVLPEVDLKIAGGREKNLRTLQSWMFYAGGTSCLIGNYLTTLGRTPEDDLQMIRDLGLEVVERFQSAVS